MSNFRLRLRKLRRVYWLVHRWPHAFRHVQIAFFHVLVRAAISLTLWRVCRDVCGERPLVQSRTTGFPQDIIILYMLALQRPLHSTINTNVRTTSEELYRQVSIEGTSLVP